MIFEQVLAQAKERPSAIAIIDDKRTLTYRELVWGANLLAGHIEKLAPDADKIGLLIPQSAAFAVAFFGTRWLNKIAMPLNYLLRPNEMADVIKDSGLKFVLAIKHFQPLADVLTAAGVTVVYMEDIAFLRIPDERPLPQRNPHDVAVILYTSGTSGVPKGVMLTNNNLDSNARDSVAHARFTTKMAFLGILPMFHTLGLMGTALIPLMLGCKVVYQTRFSPIAFLDAVAKHNIEVLITVPSMCSVLGNSKNATREALAPIKYAISGGEPLPAQLVELYESKFGIALLEGFGLTETSPIIALSLPWAHKRGSVGTLIPEMRVKFIDDEGRELPAGEEGELVIKGPNVMKGYYQKPEETAAVLSPDGWFKTGDIARIDSQGYLFITGRKKDMIIMAGEKVFPREIEEVIKQHPAVLLVGVVGVKDPARGEMPVAFVQLKPEAESKPSANEIRAWVRERIAPYKTPRDVIFLEDMPRSPTGKVVKRDLLKILSQSCTPENAGA